MPKVEWVILHILSFASSTVPPAVHPASRDRVDTDALIAAAIGAHWNGAAGQSDETIEPFDADAEAVAFQKTLTSICDAAMPRARDGTRKAANWWSESIAALRDACEAARRRFKRIRRRRIPDAIGASVA